MTRPAGAVACAGCQQVADEPPLGWSLQVDATGPRWLCAHCTREHVRSIECRLDEGWG